MPNAIPDPASVRCPKVDDELARHAVPTHARLLEPLIEYHLASRFSYAAAGRIADLLPLSIVHVPLVFLQVVQRRRKSFLVPLSPPRRFCCAARAITVLMPPCS